MEEEKYWDDFAENISMVLSYENACAECLEFLKKYGKINISFQDICGREFDVESLIERLTQQFQKNEEYEKCKALLEIDGSHEVNEPLLIENFKKNAKIVFSFEDNCEVCWEVFQADEMIPFYSMKQPQDFVSLMRIIINHFHEKEQYNRCAYLKDIYDEVKADFPDGKLRR